MELQNNKETVNSRNAMHWVNFPLLYSLKRKMVTAMIKHQKLKIINHNNLRLIFNSLIQAYNTSIYPRGLLGFPLTTRLLEEDKIPKKH